MRTARHQRDGLPCYCRPPRSCPPRCGPLEPQTIRRCEVGRLALRALAHGCQPADSCSRTPARTELTLRFQLHSSTPVIRGPCMRPRRWAGASPRGADGFSQAPALLRPSPARRYDPVRAVGRPAPPDRTNGGRGCVATACPTTDPTHLPVPLPLHRSFTTGANLVHLATCCIDETSAIQARFSTCHGYGNGLMRIDSRQFEGLASELGGPGGDSDGGLVLGVIRDPGRFDRRVAPGPHRGRVALLEQQRCQPPHVPLDAIGEHAQQDTAAHLILAVDVDWADPEKILARAEGPLGAGEALAGLRGGIGGSSWCGWRRGRRGGPRQRAVGVALPSDARSNRMRHWSFRTQSGSRGLSGHRSRARALHRRPLGPGQSGLRVPVLTRPSQVATHAGPGGFAVQETSRVDEFGSGNCRLAGAWSSPAHKR